MMSLHNDIITLDVGFSLVFRRKGLCEARPKMQSVFKFSDVLFALSQMETIGETLGQVDIFDRSLGQGDLWSDGPPPPLGETSGQVDIFVRSSGQADHWSDGCPSSDILWPNVFLLQSG